MIIQWSITQLSTFISAHNRLPVITVGFCLNKTSRLFVLDVVLFSRSRRLSTEEDKQQLMNGL